MIEKDSRIGESCGARDAKKSGLRDERERTAIELRLRSCVEIGRHSFAITIGHRKPVQLESHV